MLALFFFTVTFCFLGVFSQIRVVAPQAAVDLFSDVSGVINSVIPGSTATFGVPYYGKTIFGEVYYNQTTAHSFCNPSDFPIATKNVESEAIGDRYAIYLVDRGGCTFVKKVALAQRRGADAVVIVDNLNKTPVQIQHIIMSDDGFGRSIRIPSILVADLYGNKLKEAVQTLGRAVLVELEWDIPSAHVVDVDFWTSSGNQEGNRFLSSYAAWANILQDFLHFRIRNYVYGLTEPDENSMCWNTDRDLCADDPDGPGPLTGSDVLVEDVRRRCIYEATALPSVIDRDKRVSYLLWEYLATYNKECPILDSDDPRQKSLDLAYRFGIVCSNRIVAKLKGNPDHPVKIPTSQELEDCRTTFGKDYLVEDKENAAWAPLAMRINGWRYSGPLSAPTVTTAVCTAFKTQPEECEHIEDPSYINSLLHPQEESHWALWALAMLLVGVAVGSLMWCLFSDRERRMKNNIRQDVVSEVRIQMQERYHQLADDENAAFYMGPTTSKGLMPFQ
eukprot:Platyproteum_vivax@DN5806_c0_g1_i1.p1